MTELDRYLRTSAAVVDGLVVLCGPYGVTVEAQQRLGIRTRHRGRPASEWLAEVRDQAGVLVILAATESTATCSTATESTATCSTATESTATESATTEQGIGRLIGSRRAFGGHVRNVHFVEAAHNRYLFLGPNGQEEPQPTRSSVLLDSNVLMDLDAVASGRAQGSAAVEAARAFVLMTVHNDVIPALALTELCFDQRTGSWRHDRGRELRATMDAWYDGGAMRISDVTAVVEARARTLANLATRPDEALGPLPLQYAYYACLLKLAELWLEARGTFRARQRVDLLGQMVAWMRDELGTILSMPLQVARDRLVGPQGRPSGYTDLLLKMSSRPLQDLWGAAWDLSHLSQADLAVGNDDFMETRGMAVCLATADRGLALLRQRVQPAVVLKGASHQLRLVRSSSDLDRRLDALAASIDGIYAPLQDRGMRYLRGELPPAGDSMAMIPRLESGLLAALT